MQSSTFTLTTPDGTELHVNRWLPDDAPKAVVQLSHGISEHSGRYARYAQRLTDHGYAVYASDHRGHGRTSGTRGTFGQNNGWPTVVDDLWTVTGRAREEQPGLPVFLHGHSMGSFLARAYAADHGDALTGLVLSGTAGDPGVLGRFGIVVATTQARLRGHAHPSGLMDTLVFARLNAAFRPTRTKYDWLTRDQAEVDKYADDPDSGFVVSASGFAELLKLLTAVNTDAVASRIPEDLPVHLVSGGEDSLGDRGKGVRAVAEQLRRVGVREVTVTLWPGARHEVLNETNRDEVEEELVGWLDAHLPATRRSAG